MDVGEQIKVIHPSVTPLSPADGESTGAGPSERVVSAESTCSPSSVSMKQSASPTFATSPP